jgi:hypothetical protein
MAPDLPAWLVLRHDIERMCWIEIGCRNAPDAGTAFRELVLPPKHEAIERQQLGEFRVLPLDGSAHIAVELNLRDLDYKPPLEGTA